MSKSYKNGGYNGMNNPSKFKNKRRYNANNNDAFYDLDDIPDYFAFDRDEIETYIDKFDKNTYGNDKRRRKNNFE